MLLGIRNAIAISIIKGAKKTAELLAISYKYKLILKGIN